MSSLAYVTVAETRRQLRISDSFDDLHLIQLIAAASGAVKNYLKSASPYQAERDENDDPYLDSDGIPVLDEDSATDRYVRPEVKQAVLILVAEWYANREGDGATLVHHALPAPVLALLYPLRDPALA